jgi:enoyl-CoA hydratase
MTELATYNLDGPIATITMDDGKVNALSIEMLRAVHGAFDRAQEDGAVVVLRGREGYFSAGFDLKTFTTTPERVVEMLRLGATLTERMLSFPTPVIAACPGHAIAAGSFVLLGADVRIGVEGPFKLGLNEVKIGLTVPWFAIELARGRLSPVHYNRAVITGATYSPAEGVVAGFLDQIVAPQALPEVSLETARALAAELNLPAHAASKLRAREAQLRALRAAIESELTVEALMGAQAPV